MIVFVGTYKCTPAEFHSMMNQNVQMIGNSPTDQDFNPLLCTYALLNIPYFESSFKKIYLNSNWAQHNPPDVKSYYIYYKPEYFTKSLRNDVTCHIEPSGHFNQNWPRIFFHWCPFHLQSPNQAVFHSSDRQFLLLLNFFSLLLVTLCKTALLIAD